MKNPRFYDRLAAFIAIFLLSALGALTYYLAELSNKNEPIKKSTAKTHEPDYFVENFTVVKLNTTGAPAFRLTAKKMIHFPDDDTTEFTSPKLVSLDKTKPAIIVTSNLGKAGPKGDITELMDRVEFTRSASPESPLLKMQTEYMLIDTKMETGTTDKPVKISQGKSQITGDGMDFDNLRRMMAVHANVKTTFVSEKNSKN